jgi:Protein of unknown function (DUF1295)
LIEARTAALRCINDNRADTPQFDDAVMTSGTFRHDSPRFEDTTMSDGFFINLHKVMVWPVVLGLMWWFNNVSIEMCVYAALHGTYSLLWLMKQSSYPDRRFDARRPIWIGILFVFLPLASYYVAPYLVASRHVSLPAPAIAAIIALYTLGVFSHYVSDAQKFYTLRAAPSLITDGLFSRVRNPNYLGEIMIYRAMLPCRRIGCRS